MIHHLARARLVLPGLVRPVGRRGRELEDSALLAEFVSSLRREFGFVGVRAQTRLLLDRLELLGGEVVGEVARWRGGVAAAERVAADERAAQATAIRCNRTVVQRGRFMTR